MPQDQLNFLRGDGGVGIHCAETPQWYHLNSMLDQDFGLAEFHRTVNDFRSRKNPPLELGWAFHEDARYHIG